MAIIVRHVRNGNEYLLLSAGLALGKGGLPPRFLRNFIPEEESGEGQWLTLCDRTGCILRLPASEVTVIEIEGKKPSELLPEPARLETPNLAAEELVDSSCDELAEDGDEDEDEDWI